MATVIVMDLMLRRRVGLTAQNPDLISSPEDLARIEALAADEVNAADALLLGWYYCRHKEAGKALDWFDKARKRDPLSAKAVEGYSLALIELDRFADAETAGYDRNDKSEDNLAAYLIAAVGLLATDPPLKIAEPVLQRMAAVIVRVKSLQGGEQLGWYAYNLGQVKTAMRWFETVRRWEPNYEPAAYGLAVARWALKDSAGVNAIIREWGDRSERIANIGKPVRAELRGSTPVIDVVVDEVEATRPRIVEPPAYAETEVITEVALCRPRGSGRGRRRRIVGGQLRELGAGPLALAESALRRGWWKPIASTARRKRRSPSRLRSSRPAPRPARMRPMRLPRQSPLGGDRPRLGGGFGRADVEEAPGRVDPRHPQPAGHHRRLCRRPLCRGDPRAR